MEYTTTNVKTMKQLLGKGYNKMFKHLMQKDWDYGPHPFKTQSARLGKRTLRQRLDSKLMKAVLKSYIDDHNNNKYKWILHIFDTFLIHFNFIYLRKSPRTETSYIMELTYLNTKYLQNLTYVTNY